MYWGLNSKNDPVYNFLTLYKKVKYNVLCVSQVGAGVEEPWDEVEVWRSDLYLLCGVLGLGVLSLLAITSLPSVGNSLNWREFTFVQVSPYTPHHTALVLNSGQRDIFSC